MKKITSACANKMIRKYEEDKRCILAHESQSSTYVTSNVDEEYIPEYDFAESQKRIDELDKKIARLKHSLNLANALAQIQVGDEVMSVDMILIRMAQLNGRIERLDMMRKRIPKTREGSYGSSLVTEYRCVNYDINLVSEEYERLYEKVIEMQIALDRYNQMVEFEVLS